MNSKTVPLRDLRLTDRQFKNVEARIDVSVSSKRKDWKACTRP